MLIREFIYNERTAKGLEGPIPQSTSDRKRTHVEMPPRECPCLKLMATTEGTIEGTQIQDVESWLRA